MEKINQLTTGTTLYVNNENTATITKEQTSEFDNILNELKNKRYYTEEMIGNILYLSKKLHNLPESEVCNETYPEQEPNTIIEKLNHEISRQHYNNLQLTKILQHLKQLI